MEFQVTKNQQGIRNLYFGHPFSSETYTNSVQLRTPVKNWITDLDGVYQGHHLLLTPGEPVESNSFEDEQRVIRGTKCLFIGDFEKIIDMQEDVGVYHDLCSKATIKVNNPDYLDFEAYTAQILNDPMKSIYDVQDVTVEQAKKYMEYGILYDKDEVHSNKLILKPYFVSFDEGVLILTNDFVDFNLNLKIDPEQGVVGCEFWLSENTSHYLNYYKEI